MTNSQEANLLRLRDRTPKRCGLHRKGCPLAARSRRAVDASTKHPVAIEEGYQRRPMKVVHVLNDVWFDALTSELQLVYRPCVERLLTFQFRCLIGFAQRL